jgi:uncharacterized membrane protein YkoI
MNKIISNKKTMLGIILGMAIVAIVGVSVSAYADTQSNGTGIQQFSVNIPQIQGSININQVLMQSVKVKFVDATNTALGTESGGTVIGGELGPYQGYYVYNFSVLDSTGKMHNVIVDAGNGKVLSNTEMPLGFSGMPGKVVMYHGTAGSMGDVTYQAGSPVGGPFVIQTAPSK